MNSFTSKKINGREYRYDASTDTLYRKEENAFLYMGHLFGQSLNKFISEFEKDEEFYTTIQGEEHEKH